MEQLTPLERELMRSVSDLLSGTEREIADLKTSLRTYDASVTSGLERRLNALANTQTALEQRLSELEAQQKQTFEKLAAILRGFTERLTASEAQLSGYESATRSLSAALSKLVK